MISPKTVAIEEANDACEKDMSEYLKTVNEHDKMKFGVKAMRMVRDVMVMGKNTIFEPAEKKHRMRHCDKAENAEHKKMCKYMAGKLIREGKVNYMTITGK